VRGAGAGTVPSTVPSLSGSARRVDTFRGSGARRSRIRHHTAVDNEPFGGLCHDNIISARRSRRRHGVVVLTLFVAKEIRKVEDEDTSSSRSGSRIRGRRRILLLEKLSQKVTNERLLAMGLRCFAAVTMTNISKVSATLGERFSPRSRTTSTAGGTSGTVAEIPIHTDKGRR
jgi:hypothetical protein